MKEYTIVRRRVVTQICTDQIQAKSEKEALRTMNKWQSDGDAGQDINEWFDLDDVIEYPRLGSDDVLEANEVDD